MAAPNASRPMTGSSTIKPANVARMTTVDAIVILIMFSNLLPFCVWYVNYGSALQVFVIYKEFVIVLLFSRE